MTHLCSQRMEATKMFCEYLTLMAFDPGIATGTFSTTGQEVQLLLLCIQLDKVYGLYQHTCGKSFDKALTLTWERIVDGGHYRVSKLLSFCVRL